MPLCAALESFVFVVVACATTENGTGAQRSTGDDAGSSTGGNAGRMSMQRTGGTAGTGGRSTGNTGSAGAGGAPSGGVGANAGSGGNQPGDAEAGTVDCGYSGPEAARVRELEEKPEYNTCQTNDDCAALDEWVSCNCENGVQVALTREGVDALDSLLKEIRGVCGQDFMRGGCDAGPLQNLRCSNGWCTADHPSCNADVGPFPGTNREGGPRDAGHLQDVRIGE